MSVGYCCVTNHPSTYRPTTTTILSLMNLPFGQSSSGTACVCFIWCQVGQRDWGLENLLARWLTSLAAQLVPAAAGSSVVCGLEVSVPLHVGFCMGHLAFFMVWHWVPRSSNSRNQTEAISTFVTYPWKSQSAILFSPQILPDSAGGETMGAELSLQPSLEKPICHSPNRKVYEGSRVFRKPNVLASSLQTLAR